MIRGGNIFFFNGKRYSLQGNIFEFFKNFYGYKKILKKLFILRFEHKIKIPHDFNFIHANSFKKLFYKKSATGSTFKRQILFSILMHDFIYSYKGIRHYKSLPVKAQTTRNNAKTAGKLNISVKIFKLKKARNFYGNLPSYELNVALAAEHLNLLYFLNFPYHWWSGKYALLFAQAKRVKIKIDLYSMANNQVMFPSKFNKLTKKQKQAFKQNHFSLGFNIGFTKHLLRDLYKSRIDPTFKSKTNRMLVFRKTDGRKKLMKKPRKKPNIKQKKLAHMKKMKSKKSVWD